MTEPASPRWGGRTAGPPSTDPFRPGPLDPAVAVGLLQRARTLAQQGDWALAATTFQRVVGDRDPNLHTAALLGLAEARYRMDDEEGALQCWLSATQAPETQLSWRAWKALAAARVRSGDLVGAARAYREAERRAPADERPEIASRLGWLNKEMGDTGAAQRYFSRSRAGSVGGVWVTWAIIGLTVVVGAITMLPGIDSDLYDQLALFKPAVAAGEWWRLLTVVLVHGGWLHLALNMYALYIVGPIVEALYGPARFLLVYLLCAAAGSTASYVFSGALMSVGASGAIFGLFGVLLIADRVHKPALTRNARSLQAQIGGLIIVNLLIGFTVPRIDNAAHIGGLLAGMWLGLVMVPRGAMLRSFWAPAPGTEPPRVPLDRVLRLAGVMGLLVVIAGGVLVGPLRII